ncbi:ROK family protein [Longitalea arenae]|uniref:ROK family protein n=1 Tax=Longitalea arenae TaxID=2812558 RepID=UPI0019681C3E|nr:ROK family protein [Longitalea arenae]
MSESFVIGADIGGSHITAAQVDVHRKQVLLPSLVRLPIDSMAAAAEVIEAWAACIRQAMQDKRLTKICLAMPGPFDYEQGICLISDQDKYPLLYGLNVKKMLAQVLGIQPSAIYLNNDAACFLQGEVFGGSVSGYQQVISVTLGTGLGTAVFANGQATSADLWNMPFKEGIAEDYLSARWFANQYTAIAGSLISGVKELAGLAMRDESVKTLFTEFGRNLGAFLIRFIEQTGAAAVVIGGNIAQSYPLFKEALHAHIQRRFPEVPIVRSELGELAALLGAAGFYFNHLHTIPDQKK